MMFSTRTISNGQTFRKATQWNARARIVRPANPQLNTLDQVLHLTRSYSQEIRQDAKARRVYKSFVALTNNQFEALLAFSLWKVRNLSFSL